MSASEERRGLNWNFKQEGVFLFVEGVDNHPYSIFTRHIEVNVGSTMAWLKVLHFEEGDVMSLGGIYYLDFRKREMV